MLKILLKPFAYMPREISGKSSLPSQFLKGQCATKFSCSAIVRYRPFVINHLSTWPPGEARSLRLKRVVQAAAYFPPAGRFPACRLHTGPVWWAGRWGAARSWAPCQSFQSEPNKIRNFNVKLNSFLDDYWPKHTLYWGKMLSSPIESPIPEFMYLKINN